MKFKTRVHNKAEIADIYERTAQRIGVDPQVVPLRYKHPQDINPSQMEPDLDARYVFGMPAVAYHDAKHAVVLGHDHYQMPMMTVALEGKLAHELVHVKRRHGQSLRCRLMQIYHIAVTPFVGPSKDLPRSNPLLAPVAWHARFMEDVCDAGAVKATGHAGIADAVEMSNHPDTPPHLFPCYRPKQERIARIRRLAAQLKTNGRS